MHVRVKIIGLAWSLLVDSASSLATPGDSWVTATGHLSRHRRPSHHHSYSRGAACEEIKDKSRRCFLVESCSTFVALVAAIPLKAAADGEPTETPPPGSPNGQSAETVATAPETVVAETTHKTDFEEILALEKDEKTLLTEIDKESADEAVADGMESKLIQELEGLDSSKAESVPARKELMDNLEKEEERIEVETKELISSIEKLEQKAEEIKQPLLSEPAADAPSAIAKSQADTEQFLGKLRDRVDEKEDLISVLKSRSSNDIDPKTGKYRYMSRKEFNSKSPTDFDFLGYLKESLTNNKEFERDLEAFRETVEARVKDVESMLNI